MSACDTARGSGELGDLPAGEELVGLTRAFLSAGSRHVLATLWAVKRKITSSLMTEFYRGSRTEPWPEGLSAVQRQYAHWEGPDSHPWVWASFVMATRHASAPETRRAGP